MISGNLSTMGCGILLGWTSPVLVKLEKSDPVLWDNPLNRAITKNESSWIGSLIPFGVMFGTIASSYLGEWLVERQYTGHGHEKITPQTTLIEKSFCVEKNTFLRQKNEYFFSE